MNSFNITLLVLCAVFSVHAVKNIEMYDYDYEYSDYIKHPHTEKHEVPGLMKPHYDLKDAPQLFENFIIKYNKQYKDDADKRNHYQIFVKTLESIIRINKESKTQVSDINQFADLDRTQLTYLTGTPGNF
ncbi:hypothetical protein K1T71_007281 [Dendrolimus kikuchii]|uniref:Uncharacterized protein n=1 Tax=Dendrolimus kikuchii TaxID=765133 RepID=A0ACC1D080_9NEOP|nr:hypothetical protein K1T71_007281 [Dendrolimus kikuchii]